ncbi:DHS-like NAD/FAD-binding domain-containing protein [Suillus variegatus]|nr:DHS-like NAD/FAD-binding domain-containing protein [Suillus variegatus]
MPDLDLPPSPSSPSLNQGGIMQDTQINDVTSLSLPPQAYSETNIATRVLSRCIGGVEVVDEDLDCLRNSKEQVKDTIMNAYTILVSGRNTSLTQAGCVVISSLVPHFIQGHTSLGTTLENIVSWITKRKLLASRCWAFPLSGGRPLHWVLGWVDWSTHEIGFFDSLGIHPAWARKDLQDAAAGLEHWLKYETYPEIKSLAGRFKDWKFYYHTPPKDQKPKDSWSCGLFVMMAIPGLSNLDFSCVHRSHLRVTKTSALKAIEKIKLAVVSSRSKRRKDHISSSMNHSEPSSSSSNDTPGNNYVLKSSGSEEVQKLQEIILNAKNLIIICGPGVSVSTGSSPLFDASELLCPIIWQDQAQSSSVFQTVKLLLNHKPTKNWFYQAIHSLDRRGNLLRIYTQNIDTMEKTTGGLSFGLPKSIYEPNCPRCIPLLGRLDQMSCTLGRHVVPSATSLNQSASDGLPICTGCEPYTSCGHHGICRPNIVVSKEEQPDLNVVLAHDKNLVDVVLAVGVQPIPYSNLPVIIKQFAQAAQLRTQEGIASSILIDLDMPTLEKTGVQELFQISLALDLQDFFGSIVHAAYQDASHNPASNTMLIPKKLTITDFSMKPGDNPEEEEKEEGAGDLEDDKLLMTLRPWYFPVI